jgi:putative SOS response-associated peptidase YedK
MEPIVHCDAKAGSRALDVMRWGLIPYWVWHLVSRAPGGAP